LVQTFAPAKLFQVFEQWRQRQIRREARALISATAAAAGGKAALDRYRQLERELKGSKPVQRRAGSEIPLSQEEFEAMMAEDSE
jgi:hypothetical protein